MLFWRGFELYSRWVPLLQVCTRVTEELHPFLSQPELSNFFVYIIIDRKTVKPVKDGRSIVFIVLEMQKEKIMRFLRISFMR